MLVEARRIRSKKTEGKRVKGDGDNVELMWEQVKWVIVERAREVCGSVRVG